MNVPNADVEHRHDDHQHEEYDQPIEHQQHQEQQHQRPTRRIRRRPNEQQSTPTSSLVAPKNNESSVLPTSPTVTATTTTSSLFIDAIYISFCSIWGNICRVYICRLFGGDCEDDNSAPHDFFTSWFSQVCITSNGMSSHTGGSLFRDLPSNMIGCFILGILTHKDHPLQKDHYKTFHTGLGVGFCGSLTTFSSWNTQMVTMMDGTHAELGSQIGSALFGYLLGMLVAIGSFQAGQLVSGWIYSKNSKNDSPSEPSLPSPDSHEDNHDDNHDDEEEPVSSTPMKPTMMTPPLEVSGSSSPDEEQREEQHNRILCGGLPILLLLGTLGLVIAILVGYIRDGNDGSFYQQLFFVILVAPLGALIRWTLSRWYNPPPNPVVHSPRQRRRRLSWMPWGTFIANMTGCFVSILCTGLLDRYRTELDRKTNQWPRVILIAIRVGFAGSLTTVSTMIKEIVSMQEKIPGTAKSTIYGIVTCLTGMMMGLVVYMIIVRV